MTAPLSNDLRERVVAAVLNGESSRAVAARFEVAVSSVVKWSQRYRATGSVRPGKMGGRGYGLPSSIAFLDDLQFAFRCPASPPDVTDHQVDLSKLVRHKPILKPVLEPSCLC
jgi:hypothetical protein